MEKLLLMIALCLFRCTVSVAELENGNIGQPDRITMSINHTFSTENSFEDQVGITFLPDSGMQSKVKTTSISETTKLEELPNISERKISSTINPFSLVYPESVLNGSLSKNSSNEKKGDEKITITESLTKDNKEINSSHPTISETSAIYDEGKVESHSAENTTQNNSTNYLVNIPDSGTIVKNSTIDVSPVSSDKHTTITFITPEVSTNLTDSTLHTQENSEKVSLVSTPDSSKQNIMQSSSTHEYMKEGNDTLTAMEFPNLKSSLSTMDDETRTRVHSNFSNSSVVVSHEDKFSTTGDPITSSIYFTSEHSEGFLSSKLQRGDENIHIDDINNSSTYFASGYSEKHLVVPSVGEILDDTDFTITPGRNFTEENNYLTALNNSKEKSTILELLTKDGKEINSSHPTISESSVIYKEENVESRSPENTTQITSTNYLVNITDTGIMDENSTIDVSPVSLDKHATITSIIPEVLFSTNLTDSTLHTQENTEKVSLVSTPDSSNQNISDYVTEKDTSHPSKETLNQVYKLTLTRNCSDVFSSQAMQLITEILNRRLNAQNSTELVRCVNVYEFNFTSDIVSRESFDEAVRIIHETMNPEVEASIVNYSSIVNDVSRNRHVDSENFVIPKFFVYISTALTILVIMFMIFVVLCLRRKCKKSSTSVDLSHMPHVAFSLDDYKVAPIPRPSISYPETNRDFLYAYSNETYSRTPDDLIIQRHYSNGIGKETDASKLQKENSMTLEMGTFDKMGDVKRNRSKSATDYEYASAGYWDRLRGRGVGKRQGQDSSAMKW